MNPIAILFLAAFVEGFTEYLFSDISAMKPYLKYVALVLGMLTAVIYHVDIISQVAGLSSYVPHAGEILTGLIIGRGSNYLNDMISMIRK